MAAEEQIFSTMRRLAFWLDDWLRVSNSILAPCTNYITLALSTSTLPLKGPHFNTMAAGPIPKVKRTSRGEREVMVIELPYVPLFQSIPAVCLSELALK